MLTAVANRGHPRALPRPGTHVPGDLEGRRSVSTTVADVDKALDELLRAGLVTFKHYGYHRWYVAK